MWTAVRIRPGRCTSWPRCARPVPRWSRSARPRGVGARALRLGARPRPHGLRRLAHARRRARHGPRGASEHRRAGVAQPGHGGADARGALRPHRGLRLPVECRGAAARARVGGVRAARRASAPLASRHRRRDGRPGHAPDPARARRRAGGGDRADALGCDGGRADDGAARSDARPGLSVGAGAEPHASLRGRGHRGGAAPRSRGRASAGRGGAVRACARRACRPGLPAGPAPRRAARPARHARGPAPRVRPHRRRTHGHRGRRGAGRSACRRSDEAATRTGTHPPPACDRCIRYAPRTARLRAALRRLVPSRGRGLQPA